MLPGELFHPGSVAVVGASRDPNAVGSLIFRAILRSNFHGTVYPVNNQAVSVHGVRAYASLADLPERPDLVVVAVPAPNVLDVVSDALSLGLSTPKSEQVRHSLDRIQQIRI